MSSSDSRNDLVGAAWAAVMIGREAGVNLLGFEPPRQIKTSKGDQQGERHSVSEAREDLRAR